MCGIVGIAHFDPDHDDIASRISWALVELEHRGKEASGIATDRGLLKGRGTPEQVFNESNLENLGGHIGIGHVLYTTSGKTVDPHSLQQRAQPQWCRVSGKDDRPIYFAFNGNLTNWKELAEECWREGYEKPIINDTGVIAALIECSASASFEKVLIYEVLPRLQWSFSIIFYDVANSALYAARDRLGFMPLFIGRRGREFLIAASEDCVFAEGSLNCSLVYEVMPGSIVRLDPKRLREQIEKDDKHDDGTIQTEFWNRRPIVPKHCIFHWIYFLRPDGTWGARNVKMTQKNAGMRLAVLHPPPSDADFVAPVRDSGFAAAAGFALQSRLPLEPDALFRPHTVGRTFMEPHQKLREEGVGKKHRVIPEVVCGKSILLVDDSVVRATTLQKIIRRLRSAGAHAVHVRIASPPIRYPCVYGIDTPTLEELAWNRCGKSVEGIRAFIDADSLGYLDSIEENKGAILDTAVRSPYHLPLDRNSFCTQCFTGENAVSELECLLQNPA
ncbi:MAG: hypothetical protein HYS44_00605 [Candidatus Niyogibacteria bacterium]|nr:hypothetical protein [Candidatus Niyogibacteria bacterium]